MGNTWRSDRVSSRGAVVLLLLMTPACRLLQGAVEAPGKVLHTKKDEPPAASAVQGDVMRFADRFDAQILEATRSFSDRVGTPAARIQALDWSIRARTEALTIASGPNPSVALLDMLVAVTLGRLDHEEHWKPHVWGDADQPMLDAYTSLETEIWDVARRTFDGGQLDQVRKMLDALHKDDPEQASAAPASLADFEHLLAAHREEKKNTFEELGKLFSLDPLAGLEPAKREIAEARLLGERTLFYAQRAPMIFSSQAELLGVNLANLPEVHEALQKSDRVTESVASLADTAAKLPAAVRSEREALERDLAASEAPVEKMLGDARETLAAARDSSAAIESDGLRGTRARIRARARIPRRPVGPSTCASTARLRRGSARRRRDSTGSCGASIRASRRWSV